MYSKFTISNIKVMMKKQQGFAATTIIVVMLIVGIIGTLSYVFVNQTDNATTPLSTPTQAVAGPTDSQKKTAAITVVKQTYEYYVANRKATATDAAVDINFSSKLKEAIKNNKLPVDPIICAQDFPTSFSYSGATLDNLGAHITVTGSYSNSPANTIDVVVDPSSNNITSITCKLKS